ncbi:transporter substrate-binding domain-containing protein [Butyrivibrio sp. AE3004]|uniref:transporter substrate-binding domain-containing protein n=1 Tax=Butyrivibrio sp. AE3004 TaxID=1506994 RepID=UPI000493BB59|nr:transporter substrate-binding domain-containing protein [Butyrivibrio sp. AE3004]
MFKRIISAMLPVIICIIMLTSCKNREENLVGSDAKEDNSEVKIIDVMLTEEEYGIGVCKDKPELLKQINAFIEKGLVDGTYDEITGHYFGDGEPHAVYSETLDSSKDQLVVATTGDFEPFDYDEGNAYYGIDKELVKAIADSLGKELVLQNMNFDILFITVSQGKCDICIAGITINDERKEYVDFSVPYFRVGQCIATKTGNKELDYAKTKEDVENILKGFDKSVTIAVESETTGEEYLEGQVENFEGVRCNVLKCQTLHDCLIALNNGSADYVIGDSATLKYLIANE